MCKFVVLSGRNYTPGTAGVFYEIYDTVSFDPKKDIENQIRKYSYRYFYIKGKRANKLRTEVFCRRRHILKGDGSVFAEKVKVFDHEDGSFLAFVPKECFDF